MNTRGTLTGLLLCGAVLAGCGSGLSVSISGPTRTPTNPSAAAATPYVAGTVIAGFGKLEPFENWASAERRLGWRPLRPTDMRFHLIQQGGLLRTDSATGLSRIEQAYSMENRSGNVEIFQQPESYRLVGAENARPRSIGPREGLLAGELPHGLFYFFSGQEIEGQRIRVVVYTNQSSDLSEEDVVDFVASLAIP